MQRDYHPACDGRCGGYSLVETVVALALALTVLAPLCSVVLRLATAQGGRHEVEALALAQQCMERTLQQETYASETYEAGGGAWRVVRRVTQDARRVTVVVVVYRRRAALPLVELATVRLL